MSIKFTRSKPTRPTKKLLDCTPGEVVLTGGDPYLVVVDNGKLRLLAMNGYLQHGDWATDEFTPVDAWLVIDG